MLQERMRTKVINHKPIGVVSLRCLLSFAAEFCAPTVPFNDTGEY